MKEAEIKKSIQELRYYNKLVNDKCFNRAIKLLKEYKVYVGRYRDDRS